jgi:hypothetical protein
MRSPGKLRHRYRCDYGSHDFCFTLHFSYEGGIRRHCQSCEELVAFWHSVASNARIGVHFLAMKLSTRLFAVAALLALLGVPGLSCFVPQQLLGADEKECCRQMASQCGSKEMPSPQSCCKSPSQQGVQPYIGSSEHSRIVPVTTVTAFLPVESTPILLVAESALTIAQFHSPPLSLSETNSVLRI